MFLPLCERANGTCPLNHPPHHFGTGSDVVLKVLLGVVLGFVLFTNEGARQITADALRAAADALASEKEGKNFQDRVRDLVEEKILGEEK